VNNWCLELYIQVAFQASQKTTEAVPKPCTATGLDGPAVSDGDTTSMAADLDGAVITETKFNFAEPRRSHVLLPSPAKQHVCYGPDL
jgi:hypothetical protein